MFVNWIIETFNLCYREAWAVNRIVYHFKEAFSGFSIKGFIASMIAVAELFGMLFFGAPVSPHGQELNLDGYKIVFSDEFDHNELDTENWFTRGNGPRRCGYNAASQVEVRNGNLVITGEYLKDGEYGEGWYTGAVALNKKYKQGYFEIRCKCNDSDGFWSAFWIQADHPYEAQYSKGGTGGAEIDIFESAHYGETGGYCVSSAIHCAGVDGEQEGYQSALLGFFRDNDVTEYNTYGLEWTEDEYIFYINGVETTRSTFGNGVSQVAEDVIVSLEIPDESGLEGFDKDTFQTEFIVDYVKIYQK